LEIGIYSFADITPNWRSGHSISVEQRFTEIVAAAKLADEAGLDLFGIGEHHRLDIAISATPVVLAAIAAATKRIRTDQCGDDPFHRGPREGVRELCHGGRAVGWTR
jgi:alkanesulfonate monooxygenase SsuD/methylene tetrahydromethanopterin reductase-like flavin-dependent oxidoreductase (luciferase family)